MMIVRLLLMFDSDGMLLLSTLVLFVVVFLSLLLPVVRLRGVCIKAGMLFQQPTVFVLALALAVFRQRS
jgi:hypothetical protein